MKRLLIVATALLVACQSVPASNAIGGASLAITTIAMAVKEECGNTVPDGPCTPDSWISTADKQKIKVELGDAVAAVRAADEALRHSRDATGWLAKADAIIAAVQRFVRARGEP
tara:strand:- start:4725 stop:5066 length:342 start_codon:yes stop_codon:yes gene_type:complete